MFCFASYVCRVNFYGRNAMGFRGVFSLICLCGCSRFVLSSVCVGSLVVLGFFPVGGFYTPAAILVFTAPK